MEYDEGTIAAEFGDLLPRSGSRCPLGRSFAHLLQMQKYFGQPIEGDILLPAIYSSMNSQMNWEMSKIIKRSNPKDWAILFAHGYFEEVSRSMISLIPKEQSDFWNENILNPLKQAESLDSQILLTRSSVLKVIENREAIDCESVCVLSEATLSHLKEINTDYRERYYDEMLDVLIVFFGESHPEKHIFESIAYELTKSYADSPKALHYICLSLWRVLSVLSVPGLRWANIFDIIQYAEPQILNLQLELTDHFVISVLMTENQSQGTGILNWGKTVVQTFETLDTLTALKLIHWVRFHSPKILEPFIRELLKGMAVNDSMTLLVLYSTIMMTYEIEYDVIYDVARQSVMEFLKDRVTYNIKVAYDAISERLWRTIGMIHKILYDEPSEAEQFNVLRLLTGMCSLVLMEEKPQLISNSKSTSVWYFQLNLLLLAMRSCDWYLELNQSRSNESVAPVICAKILNASCAALRTTLTRDYTSLLSLELDPQDEINEVLWFFSNEAILFLKSASAELECPPENKELFDWLGFLSSWYAFKHEIKASSNHSNDIRRCLSKLSQASIPPVFQSHMIEMSLKFLATDSQVNIEDIWEFVRNHIQYLCKNIAADSNVILTNQLINSL